MNVVRSKSRHSVTVSVMLAILAGCSREPAFEFQTHTSRSLGVKLLCPVGWQVSESKEELLLQSHAGLNATDARSFEKDQGIIGVLIDPKRLGPGEEADPAAYLVLYTIGFGRPYKEEPSHVTLNGKDFAVAALEITASREPPKSPRAPVSFRPCPNRAAVHVTAAKRVIAVSLYTSPTNERRFRKLFETVLGSLEAD